MGGKVLELESERIEKRGSIKTLYKVLNYSVDKIAEILHISCDEVEEIINILQKEEKELKNRTTSNVLISGMSGMQVTFTASPFDQETVFKNTLKREKRETQLETIISCIEDGDLSVERGAKIVGLSVEELRSKALILFNKNI